MGGSFLSLGLFISSLTKQPDRRRRWSPSAVFLMLWVINWVASFVGPTAQTVLDYAVDHRALRRLRQGHHRHPARRLLRQLHRVGPVPHREVGGQRTVAGVAHEHRNQRSIGGPTSSASSAGSARCSSSRRWASASCGPEWAQYQQLRDVGRPRAGAGVPGRPVARGRRRSTRAATPRYGTLSLVSVLVFAGHPRRGQLPGLAPEQALGPHRQPGLQPVGSDHQAPAGPRRAGEVHGLRPGAGASTATATASTPTRTSRRNVTAEYVDADKNPTARQGRRGHALRHHRRRVQGPHRARHRAPTSRTSPTR